MFLCYCHRPSKVLGSFMYISQSEIVQEQLCSLLAWLYRVNWVIWKSTGDDKQQILLRMSAFPSHVIALVVGAINGSVRWQEIRQVLSWAEVHANVSVQRSITLHWDAQCLWHELPISYSDQDCCLMVQLQFFFLLFSWYFILKKCFASITGNLLKAAGQVCTRRRRLRVPCWWSSPSPCQIRTFCCCTFLGP